MFNIKYETMIDDIEDLDIPTWVDADGMNGASIESIQYGGCASGAYMPAVTYHIAKAIMNEHGDDVLDYIEECFGEIPQPETEVSWSGIACFYLSTAVELWAGQFEISDSNK